MYQVDTRTRMTNSAICLKIDMFSMLMVEINYLDIWFSTS